MNGEYDYVARIVAPTLAAYEALTDAFLTDSGFGHRPDPLHFRPEDR